MWSAAKEGMSEVTVDIVAYESILNGLLYVGLY
jgi:hypothetical protein